MAVGRKLINAVQRRVRAKPSILSYSTDITQLVQQISRLEQSLYAAVNDGLDTVAGQLLRIIDGNADPDELMPARDYLRFSGTGVAVTYNGQWVQVTITDTTDHGSLTGLLDDDHTIYLLVDGTRALGGNWSLGNYQLSNADAIIYNGTGSFQSNLHQIDFLAGGGGYIRYLDQLTLYDSGSYINVNNGTLLNIDTAVFNGNGSSATAIDHVSMHDPSTSRITNIGYETFGARSADMASVSTNQVTIQGSNTPIGFLDTRGTDWAYVLAGYTEDATAEDADTLTVNVDMSDIKGVDFSDGMARMRVILVSVSNNQDVSYGQQFEEAWYFINSNTGTTCAVGYLYQQPEIWSPSIDQDAPYFRAGGTTTTEYVTVSETGQYTFTVTGEVQGSTSTTWTSRLIVWIEGVCQ